MKRYVIIGTQHYNHHFPVGTVVELQREREINPDSWAVVSVHSVPVLFSEGTRKLEQIVHPEDCRPWPLVGDEVIIPQGTVLLGADGEPINTRGSSPTTPVECRGRVVDINTNPRIQPDPIPYKVELVGEPVEDDLFWGVAGRRWFSADQLQPPVPVPVPAPAPAPAPIPVPVAPGRNPARLTVAQVGEGWRLLAPEEVRRKSLNYADRHSIQCWSDAQRWDDTGWSGDSDVLTYRTQRPVGYFLPKPEVKPETKTPDFKVGDEVIIPKGTQLFYASGDPVGGLTQALREYRGRVIVCDPPETSDRIPFQVEVLRTSTEPDPFWGIGNRRWFGKDQLIPAPERPAIKVGDKLFVPKGYHVPGIADTKYDTIVEVVEVVEVDPGTNLDVLARFERRDVVGSPCCKIPVEWWISSKGTRPAPEAKTEMETETEAKPAPVSGCPFKVGDAVWVPAGHTIPGVGKTGRNTIGAVIDLDASPGRVRIQVDGTAAGLPGYTAESPNGYPTFYVPYQGLVPAS